MLKSFSAFPVRNTQPRAKEREPETHHACSARLNQRVSLLEVKVLADTNIHSSFRSLFLTGGDG